MDTSIIKALICNTIFLLSLILVSDIEYHLPDRIKKYSKVISGFLIGLIGIAVMSNPFTYTEGVVFDARSVLLGVTALAFGTIPVLISSIITIIYRIICGGAGVFMGISVIISCAAIGLIWRRYLIYKNSKQKVLSIYIFGLVIHIVMLLWSLVLPDSLSYAVLSSLTLPILAIFPFCTLCLSLFVIHQKKSNKALYRFAEVQERYQSIFEGSNSVMLLIDPFDAKIVDVNLAAASFYGWTQKKMKSMKLFDLVPLPKGDVKNVIHKALNKQTNHFFSEHIKASGKIINVEVHCMPILIDEKPLLFSIVHDISQRVSANNTLLEYENRFRTLIDCAPDAIYIQANNQLVFVNKKATQLFGAQNERELIGKNTAEFIQKQNLNKPETQPFEQIYLRLDGSFVYVETTSVPIEYNSKKGEMVFVRDITERKRLESEKLQIEAQLRQNQKLDAIGTLASGVAHEVNNPINGIMNYAQLVLDFGDLSTKNKEYLNEIIHETKRVSEIVKNLLQFSRQEKQSHSFAKIEDIVNQTVSLINTIIKKDHITLNINLEPNLPDIKCRSQQIQQVLMNLLTNAKDALNEKYPDYNENKIINLSCRKASNQDGNFVEIEVKDNGNGMSDEVKNKIFEPFFSTKPKDKGTGLGLSISFGIIKDHKGTLDIDSKIGEYTSFIIRLPVDNGWSIAL